MRNIFSSIITLWPTLSTRSSIPPTKVYDIWVETTSISGANGSRIATPVVGRIRNESLQSLVAKKPMDRCVKLGNIRWFHETLKPLTD